MEHATVTVYKNALMAGAILGGTLSLLYAPHPGKETRAWLKGKAEVVRQVTHLPAHRAGDADDEDEHARKLDALHMDSVKEGEMQNRLVTMGFITGVIIGGVVGLLYAPKPGKETREFLKAKAEYTKEEARILAEHAREVAIEKARKAKAAAEAVASEAHAAAEEQNS